MYRVALQGIWNKKFHITRWIQLVLSCILGFSSVEIVSQVQFWCASIWFDVDDVGPTFGSRYAQNTEKDRWTESLLGLTIVHRILPILWKTFRKMILHWSLDDNGNLLKLKEITPRRQIAYQQALVCSPLKHLVSCIL